MPEKILEHTPFLLAHCSRDLRYVYVTKRYAEMFGRRSNDLAGKSIVEIMGPERFATIRPHIETVLRGQPVEYDAEIEVAGAGPRRCHVSYAPEHGEQHEVIGWIDSIVDITDREQAVEKERLLEQLAAEMGIGIWEWDVGTDRLIWTAEMAAMYGLEPAAIKSRVDFRNRVHPDDLAGLDARRDAAIRGRQGFQFEFRVIRPNGEIRWMLGAGRAIYDKVTGEPIRLIGFNIDVTDRKAGEEQAELQRKEIAHLTRVTTLAALSGGIAHELGQPLASILASAQAGQRMLANKQLDNATIGEILEEIVQEDTRAGEVIHRLRRLLKKGHSEWASIDLNEKVASTLRLLHSELVNREIRVETELSADLPLIWGDRIQLQQVFLNLMMNAMDAMSSIPPSQRTLSIATRTTDESYVEVSVRDSGRGIPEENLGRLFEPFFTTKASGLGLGLSISSTIVRSHNGRLTLSNATGGGAVAIVLLPAAVAS